MQKRNRQYSFSRATANCTISICNMDYCRQDKVNKLYRLSGLLWAEAKSTNSIGIMGITVGGKV